MSGDRYEAHNPPWAAESTPFDWPAGRDTVILAVDYGGTHVRAGVFLSDAARGYRCVSRASIEHDGRRERLDDFIASAGTVLDHAPGDVHARHLLGLGEAFPRFLPLHCDLIDPGPGALSGPKDAKALRGGGYTPFGAPVLG